MNSVNGFQLNNTASKEFPQIKTAAYPSLKNEYTAVFIKPYYHQKVLTGITTLLRLHPYQFNFFITSYML